MGSLVHALRPVRTSSTRLRTLASAPAPATAAMEATQHGTGSRAEVLSPAVITLTLALRVPATHTAWPLALTMCLPHPSTQHAHQVSTHPLAAQAPAPSLVTPRATLPTRSVLPMPTVSVERARSCRSWSTMAQCTLPSPSTVISQLTSLVCTSTHLAATS